MPAQDDFVDDKLTSISLHELHTTPAFESSKLEILNTVFYDFLNSTLVSRFSILEIRFNVCPPVPLRVCVCVRVFAAKMMTQLSNVRHPSIPAKKKRVVLEITYSACRNPCHIRDPFNFRVRRAFEFSSLNLAQN